MKIGIYGGTFDPPHLGHMESARAAAGILRLDRLLFVPAGIPPHKPMPRECAPARDRLAMTALMADGLGLGDWAEVLDGAEQAGEKLHRGYPFPPLTHNIPGTSCGF
jgi:nicotinate-nucleotide adenylyltransferase